MGCKNQTGWLYFLTKHVECGIQSNPDVTDVVDKKTGVPCIDMENDIIDPDINSDSRIKIRLQALFEIIDIRRMPK